MCHKYRVQKNGKSLVCYLNGRKLSQVNDVLFTKIQMPTM